MYEKFYNFKEKPFNTTPDSRYFFPSAKHTEALNSLLYAINERKGFVAITGEIGAGKTTVIRSLLNQLSLNTKVAMITNTHLTAKELVAEILDEFEVEYKDGTKQKLLSHLNRYLIRQLAADMNVVLIIDEAQNLSPTVMEEVRMLSNLETEKEKLIQIILVGQPQLKARLENPRLEQFKQRIAVYYHINSLSKEETREYIRHRLKTAGNDNASGEDIFTADAIDLVFEHSRGIPRLVNLVCDSSLLSGYVYETRNITAKIVREVIRERDFLSGAHMQSNAAVQPADAAVLPHGAKPAAKIYCCPECKHYLDCELKWVRGTKNLPQLCCDSCENYLTCITQRTTHG